MAKNDSSKLSPQKSSRGDIQQFLAQARQLPATQANQAGRLIFAIDATASRQPTWDLARGIQGEMFSSTQKLGGVRTQLCYYRGFHQFHASAWLNNSKDLLQQMNAVSCLGGHTQIARVLQHAIDEAQKNKINGVIFIGDACEEDADGLANLAGQLGIRAVPLFIFHEDCYSDSVNTQVKTIFQQLAKLSGGAYLPFNHNSAHALAALLGAIAVYASGGLKALKQQGGQAAVQLLSHLDKDRS